MILGAGGGAGSTNTELAYVAGRRRHGRRHLHRPVDSWQQAERAAADDRRRLGSDDHPVRRIAQLVAELHRDAGDALDRSGADASLAGGGVRLNYIPRDGGNTYKGLLFFTGANSSMQSTNYTTIADDPVKSLQARGLRTQPGSGREDLRFQSRLRRPAEEGQSVVVLHGEMDAAKNSVAQNYPNQNFRSAATVRSRSTTRRSLTTRIPPHRCA